MSTARADAAASSEPADPEPADPGPADAGSSDLESSDPERSEPESSEPESSEPESSDEGSTDPSDGGDDVVDEVPPRKLGLVAVVALVVVLLDQLSKHWAVNNLTDGRMVDVVGSLRFSLHFNPGAAFSLGSGGRFGPWIALLAIAVVVALSLGYPARFRFGAIAAGLITGGAAGNLIDRAFRSDEGFLHGAVVDFIDLQWWPVFNIADAAISVGAVLLVLVSLREP